MAYAQKMFSILLNMFVAPAEAFNAAREKAPIWFPLILIISCWIIFWNWYYSAVDFPWVLNQIIANELATKPVEQHEAISASISNFKPGALIIISVVTILVIMFGVTLGMGVYLTIVSAVLDDKYRFKSWFSFALWSFVPSLIAIVAMIINFSLAKDGRVGPSELNPLNFNNLLFRYGPAHPLKSMLDGLDLTVLWSWALMVIGYRNWTKRSWTQSALIILVPWVLLYGTWIVVKLT
jgi:hypothetical protein